MRNRKQCIKCEEDFWYSSEDCQWDYKGITPVKVTKCPQCKCIQAVKFEKIYNVNTDTKFYTYNGK